MAKTQSRWLAIALLTISAAILIWLAAGRAQPGGSSKVVGTREVPIRERSVVLITVDTTRADRLQPYGAEDIATPTFLRLAREGVLFERAYSVAPITLVAHTSMMTGLYPFEHGVRNNGIQYVPEDVTTLAEVLRERGYRTGAFISAAVLESQYGLDQGFEVYDDDLSKGRDRRPRIVADRPAEAAFAAASGWLDTLEDDESYFLWVHLYDPHAVYSPPAPYRDRYRDRLYDGEIAYMDAKIGEFLEHPKVAAEGDRAPLLTVIGDHGESLGEHGERTHAILAYDSTLHIPWLLRIPDGPQGVRISNNVSQVDLLPTLLELSGNRSVGGIEGTSLVPLVAGVPGELRGLYSETYLPYYTYGWAKIRVLRSGEWKYIDAPSPELYRLNQDPRELTNVLDQQPGPAHDLSRDLGELLGTVEDPEQEASLALDEESAEKLRSLGYLAAGSGGRQTGERPDPKDVIDLHVTLEKARYLLQDRFFEQAETEVRKLLARDPHNLSALIELVTALEGQKRLDDAVQAAERVLELDPDYTRIYLILGRLEAARGNTDQAVELTRLAVDRDGRNPDILITHALMLQQAGQIAEAKAALAKSLEDNPDHPRLNTAYARMVEVPMRNLDDAEKRLRLATERDPFLASAWSHLGKVLELRGHHAEAEEIYRQGLSRSPDDSALHHRLGNALARRGQVVEAEQHLREAIRLSTRFDADVWVSLGGVLAEAGRFQEAQRQYAQVLEIQPNHPGARNNSAIALYREGKMDEAQKVLEDLIEDFPNNADAHNNLAGIHVDGKRWRTAEIHARRSLEIDPEVVQAWNNLAIALEEQGNLSEASTSYSRALTLDENYWPAYINLGILLNKKEKHEEAAEAFGEALSRVPNQPVAHLELGKLYHGPLANADKARNHLNAFLKHIPAGDPRAAQVRGLLASLPAGAS